MGSPRHPHFSPRRPSLSRQTGPSWRARTCPGPSVPSAAPPARGPASGRILFSAGGPRPPEALIPHEGAWSCLGLTNAVALGDPLSACPRPGLPGAQGRGWSERIFMHLLLISRVSVVLIGASVPVASCPCLGGLALRSAGWPGPRGPAGPAVGSRNGEPGRGRGQPHSPCWGWGWSQSRPGWWPWGGTCPGTSLPASPGARLLVALPGCCPRAGDLGQAGAGRWGPGGRLWLQVPLAGATCGLSHWGPGPGHQGDWTWGRGCACSDGAPQASPSGCEGPPLPASPPCHHPAGPAPPSQSGCTPAFGLEPVTADRAVAALSPGGCGHSEGLGSGTPPPHCPQCHGPHVPPFLAVASLFILSCGESAIPPEAARWLRGAPGGQEAGHALSAAARPAGPAQGRALAPRPLCRGSLGCSAPALCLSGFWGLCGSHFLGDLPRRPSQQPGRAGPMSAVGPHCCPLVAAGSRGSCGLAASPPPAPAGPRPSLSRASTRLLGDLNPWAEPQAQLTARGGKGDATGAWAQGCVTRLSLPRRLRRQGAGLQGGVGGGAGTPGAGP